MKTHKEQSNEYRDFLIDKLKSLVNNLPEKRFIFHSNVEEEYSVEIINGELKFVEEGWYSFDISNLSTKTIVSILNKLQNEIDYVKEFNEYEKYLLEKLKKVVENTPNKCIEIYTAKIKNINGELTYVDYWKNKIPARKCLSIEEITNLIDKYEQRSN